MIYFIIILYVLVVIILYFVWAMQKKLDIIADRVSIFINKLKSDESTIVENFGIVDKRFIKFENEIKEIKRDKTKAGEIAQKISRFRKQ